MTFDAPQGPAKHVFDSSGLRCIALRIDKHMMGHWCGYVEVPAGHAAWGLSVDELDDIDVHGGVTFSSLGHPEAPEGVWWIGFDCAHYSDIIPFVAKVAPGSVPGQFGETYKTLEFVMDQCRSLAEQLSTS